MKTVILQVMLYKYLHCAYCMFWGILSSAVIVLTHTHWFKLAATPSKYRACLVFSLKYAITLKPKDTVYSTTWVSSISFFFFFLLSLTIHILLSHVQTRPRLHLFLFHALTLHLRFYIFDYDNCYMTRNHYRTLHMRGWEKRLSFLFSLTHHTASTLSPFFRHFCKKKNIVVACLSC